MKINWVNFATTVGAVVVGVIISNQIQSMIDKSKVSTPTNP
jgi:hypothetical protein